MSDNSTNNKRIAKNTMFLYLRMMVVMITVLIGFTLIQPIFMGFRVMNSENISLEDKIEIAANIATDHSLQNTDNRYEAKNLLKEMDYLHEKFCRDKNVGIFNSCRICTDNFASYFTYLYLP